MLEQSLWKCLLWLLKLKPFFPGSIAVGFDVMLIWGSVFVSEAQA